MIRLTSLPNKHDPPLLEPTLEALGLADGPLMVHVDCGYQSRETRQRLGCRGQQAAIATKCRPALPIAHQRWVVERIHAWTNAHKKLARYTERRATAVAF